MFNGEDDSFASEFTQDWTQPSVQSYESSSSNHAFGDYADPLPLDFGYAYPNSDQRPIGSVPLTDSFTGSGQTLDGLQQSSFRGFPAWPQANAASAPVSSPIYAPRQQVSFRSCGDVEAQRNAPKVTVTEASHSSDLECSNEGSAEETARCARKRKVANMTPPATVTSNKRRPLIPSSPVLSSNRSLPQSDRACKAQATPSLQPRHHEELQSMVQEFREKVAAIATLSKTSKKEVMQHALMELVNQTERDGHTNTSLGLEGKSSPAEQDAEAHQRDDQRLDLLQNYARKRRTEACVARRTQGLLPCLRPDCPARFPDKGSWIRHIKQLIVTQLWACHFCSTIFDRKERLKKHLKAVHTCQSSSSKFSCVEQEPYEVPFEGRCGFCSYTSNNFTKFFHEHVHGHLVGSLGARRCDKEDWATPYPPSFDSPSAAGKRRRRPSFDLPNALRRLSDEDDSEPDSDDDDTGSGPKPFYGHLSRTYKSAGQAGRSEPQRDPLPQQSPSTTRRAAEARYSYQDAPRRLSEAPYQHVRTVFRSNSTYVDEVKQLQSGLVFARKRIGFNWLGNCTSWQHEVTIMKKLSHAHLIRLADHFRDGDTFSLILHPLGDMTLKALLESKRNERQRSLPRWHSCLSSAVEFLHSEDIAICHGDIKPSNIIVRGSDIYLSDFGIARPMMSSARSCADNTPLLVEKRRRHIPMTPKYAAPELINSGQWGLETDVFALGCVFLEMATMMSSLSVRKYHKFMSLVQKETQYLPPHDSWDVARKLWLSVLQHRHTLWIDRLSVSKSLTASEDMLQCDMKKRPSIKVITQIFIAFTCCSGTIGQKASRGIDVHHSSISLTKEDVMHRCVESSKLDMALLHATIQRWSFFGFTSGICASNHYAKRHGIVALSEQLITGVGCWIEAQCQYSTGPYSQSLAYLSDCRDADRLRPGLTKCRTWPIAERDGNSRTRLSHSNKMHFQRAHAGIAAGTQTALITGQMWSLN